VITEVTLTSAGPDQELPLRSSFYLKGTAAGSVTTVAPIFIRYSTPVWGISPSYGCQEVAATLATRTLDGALLDGTGTVKTVGDLWKAAVAPPVAAPQKPEWDDLKKRAVLVPSPWKRTADEKEFKVLVGGKDFFAAGSYYCMFVYQRTKTTVNHAPEVRKIIAGYAADIEACSSAATAATSAAACGVLAEGTAVAKIQAIQPILATATIKQTLLPAGTDAAKARTDIHALATLSAAWLKPAIPLPGDAGNAYAPVTDPLAEAMVRLLVREGLLYPKVGAGPVVYFDDKGKLAVKNVALLDNWSGIQVREGLETVAPGKQFPIPIDLAKLVIPDTKITLLDFLNLARRKLRIGTNLVSIDTLFADSIAPAMKGSGDANALIAVAAALEDWAQALEPSPHGVRTALGAWLSASVLEDCTAAPFAPKLAGAKFVAPAPPGGNPVKCLAGVGNFGFDVQRNPFQALASRLRDYARPLEALASLDTIAIENSLKTTSFSNAPLKMSVDMSQKTFITSYVTVIVGSARLLSAEQPFSTAYTGVQIYLFPNPIDEPMWTNGWSDVGRLVGVELGVAPKTDNFGPGNRYTSPPKFPLPVFVGLAAQPVPYVTLSVGRYWAGYRSTPLSQEEPQSIGGCYFGASVQANVPDLIRALAMGGANSSTK
jgi:hypothetical protein